MEETTRGRGPARRRTEGNGIGVRGDGGSKGPRAIVGDGIRV